MTDLSNYFCVCVLMSKRWLTIVDFILWDLIDICKKKDYCHKTLSACDTDAVDVVCAEDTFS